jgi:hypothetical protein
MSVIVPGTGELKSRLKEYGEYAWQCSVLTAVSTTVTTERNFYDSGQMIKLPLR